MVEQEQQTVSSRRSDRTVTALESKTFTAVKVLQCVLPVEKRTSDHLCGRVVITAGCLRDDYCSQTIECPWRSAHPVPRRDRTKFMDGEAATRKEEETYTKRTRIELPDGYMYRKKTTKVGTSPPQSSTPTSNRYTNLPENIDTATTSNNIPKPLPIHAFFDDSQVLIKALNDHLKIRS